MVIETTGDTRRIETLIGELPHLDRIFVLKTFGAEVEFDGLSPLGEERRITDVDNARIAEGIRSMYQHRRFNGLTWDYGP
jgi:hypothetical protein